MAFTVNGSNFGYFLANVKFLPLWSKHIIFTVNFFYALRLHPSPVLLPFVNPKKFRSLNCVSIPPASHVTIFTLPFNSEMLKVLCIWCNERDWLWSSISLLQLCYSTIKTLKYLNKSFQQRLKWPTVLTSRFVGSRFRNSHNATSKVCSIHIYMFLPF